MMETKQKSKGFSRQPVCISRFGHSRSGWWQGIKAGEIPSGYKLSERTTAWSNAELDEYEELLLQGKNWLDREVA